MKNIKIYIRITDKTLKDYKKNMFIFLNIFKNIYIGIRITDKTLKDYKKTCLFLKQFFPVPNLFLSYRLQNTSAVDPNTKELWIWIRIWIRKDPKLFAESGSLTCDYGFGSGSETGDAPYQKSAINYQKKAV
jgi:hypothetical protein